MLKCLLIYGPIYCGHKMHAYQRVSYLRGQFSGDIKPGGVSKT